MLRPWKTTLVTLVVVWATLVMMVRTVRAEMLVLAAADSRPTAFLVDGKPTGILVDLVTEAYRRAGHTVEIHLMPWIRCLDEAKKGRVDGVFSSFKLPEREEFLVFPRESLTTQVISLFVRKDSDIKFDGDFGVFRTASIGVIIGTSYGNKFDEALKSGLFQRIDGTSSVKSNIEKLTAGRIDIMPSYNYVAFDAAKNLNLSQNIKELSPPVQSVPSYLAFTKVRDMNRFLDLFDGAIVSMRQDGSYDRIVGKYTN